MAERDPEEVTLNTLHEDLKVGFTDVNSALADLKGEVRGGFADLKAEVQGGFADLKAEVQGGFADLKREVRGGFADMKATLIAGFANMPTREDSQEMIRLLREGNRLHEERFTQLDLRIREQHLELQLALRALAEGQRALHEDIRALIARLDALIKGRGDGSPPT